MSHMPHILNRSEALSFGKRGAVYAPRSGQCGGLDGIEVVPGAFLDSRSPTEQEEVRQVETPSFGKSHWVSTSQAAMNNRNHSHWGIVDSGPACELTHCYFSGRA